jgi:hypothetical protein
MATPATVASAISTAVLAGTSATAATINREARTETIAAGATKVQILSSVVGRDGDSNTSRLVAEYDVKMLHRLSDPTDDATYLDGDALTDQAVLMVPSFFRDLSGVKEVGSLPALAAPTRPRPGNVIEYTVTVQLSIVP